MNFTFKNSLKAQKPPALAKAIFNAVLVLLFAASCSQKSRLSDVNGNVQVKIPASSVSGNSSQYQIQTVTLKGLVSLKEVTGFFAKFFYAPGLENNQLVGDAPQARFVKSKEGVFIPVDSISQQMAAIYYHIQNLAEFSASLGAGDINQSAMKIGIETRVGNSEALTKNNAFYDGKADAMFFVPFSSQELPITVNSGIIAHEYFHSLFYKIVLKDLSVQNETATSNTTVSADITPQLRALYNETYLRGINEGLADFWGWAYSNDDDFIRWSLSSYSKQRKLVLESQSVGQFESSENIFSKTQAAILSTANPSLNLSDYIYKIGTPHARFLKQLTMISVDEGKSLLESKVAIAKSILAFIKSIHNQQKSLSTSDVLPAEALFDFVSSADSNLKLSKSQCEFALIYVQKNQDRLTDLCVEQADKSFQVKPKPNE